MLRERRVALEHLSDGLPHQLRQKLGFVFALDLDPGDLGMTDLGARDLRTIL